MNGTGVNGILLVSDGYRLLRIVTQPLIEFQERCIICNNKVVGICVEISRPTGHHDLQMYTLKWAHLTNHTRRAAAEHAMLRTIGKLS